MFLNQRLDSHAQPEIRVYAEAGNVDKKPNRLKLWLNRREKMHPPTENQEVDSVSQEG